MGKWMIVTAMSGIIIGVCLVLLFNAATPERARNEERAKAVDAGAAVYDVTIGKDGTPVPVFHYQPVEQIVGSAVTKATAACEAQQRAAVKSALDMEHTEAVKEGLAEWAVMSSDHGPVVEFHYRSLKSREDAEKALEETRQELKLKEKELEVREINLKNAYDAVIAARKKEGAAILENPEP